jgi:hypothetical protein
VDDGEGDDEGEGDDGDEEDDDAGDDEQAAAAAAAAAAEAAAALAASQEEEQQADPTEEALLNEKPAIWLKLDAIETKRSEINGKMKDLAVKFDEGELTAGEYHEQRSALERERAPLDTEATRANIRKADDIEAWREETVPSFLKDHPAYAVKGSVLNRMLDEEVKKIQASAPNPTHANVLKLAHQRIQVQISSALGGAPAPKAEEKGKGNAPKKPGRSAKPEMPPVLGGLPAADVNDNDDGSGFAYLDRLEAKDRVAYEDALAKLPPAQLDAYLSR